MNRIKKLFTNDLYIKIYENKFEVKNISSGGVWESAYSEIPFTTERLLIGKFSAAEPVLAELVRSVLPKGFLAKSPQVVVHPVEKVEGGLCEVEERVFKELALGVGAFKVVLHVGAELTDSEVSELLNISK